MVLGVALAACSPTTSPAPSAPTVTDEAVLQGLVLGCISIEEGECLLVAEHAAAALPAARGPAFSIQVQLFGCANAAPCPRTLAAREGRATVEYAGGGDPIPLSVAGPPQSPNVQLGEGTWSEPVQASSPRVGGIGPFPFELGHCGLSHVVDFDGSFWLPLGQVDGDASGMINAERGQMLLLGPNVAQFQGESGFIAQLARFPGAKRFWLCD